MRHVSVWLRLAVATGLLGCGEDKNTNVAARVGWVFNYRDWTDANSTDDLRGCANQPAVPNGLIYPEIATVHVVVKDALGQVPGVDQEFACAQGAGDKRVDIVGLTQQTFVLVLEAKSADGTIIYRLEVPELDLTTLVEDTYTLPTVTGEMDFYPRYPGTGLSCPNGVETIKYSFFPLSGGVPASTPNLSGSHSPACVGGYSDEVFIAAIPASPDPGANGNYIQTLYNVKVEAVDGGGVTQYCLVWSNRSVNPGEARLGGDPNLQAGACP